MAKLHPPPMPVLSPIQPGTVGKAGGKANVDLADHADVVAKDNIALAGDPVQMRVGVQVAAVAGATGLEKRFADEDAHGKIVGVADK